MSRAVVKHYEALEAKRANFINGMAQRANHLATKTQTAALAVADKLGMKDRVVAAGNLAATPINKLKEVSLKEWATFSLCLAVCLSVEHHTGLPFTSGTIQLTSAILATAAFILNSIANMQDPLGNPLIDSAMLAAGGLLLYTSSQKKSQQKVSDVSTAIETRPAALEEDMQSQTSHDESQPCSPTSSK